MKNTVDISKLDWEKMDGLIPVIAQDAVSGHVLMLAYMNQEALTETIKTKQLIFYSRSKQALWRKGETSGNTMAVQEISMDCDGDSLLVQVLPAGPACHLGTTTCFQESTPPSLSFLNTLIKVIDQRATQKDSNSYTAQLLKEGLNRCAQKVGEEAVEVVIAAVSNNREELISESADLLFHFLVLLKQCNLEFSEVLSCLEQRHKEHA
jgi:phosphoribosyl-ATP pyrophosphohydrolase/phosphoribosyl-AMP cyclohydrolase